MRMTKWYKLAALAMAFALSLTACGTQEAAKQTETEKQVQTEKQTEAETAPKETSDKPEPSSEEEKAGVRTVVDHTGKEIVLPEHIDRIVISSLLPLPSVYCLFEGSAEKLVGMHPSSMAAAENSILPKIMPDILDVNTDFLQGGEINVEELLNLQPDVVFYSANNTEEYEKISAAGIPAVGFSTSNWGFDCIQTFENWVKLLGEVLNEEDKAAGIAEYGHQVYEEVQAVLAEGGEYEKPKVLILFNYANGIIKTSGSNFFGQYWIDSTGGVNVAEDLKGTVEINMEQVYEWDPDIIYITNFSPYQPEDLYENAIEGHDWSTVKAVQNQKVYKFPLGMYRWFPPASDTPLVLKWLAQKNQPELFSEVDMEKEVRQYYSRFYGVDLTDDDVEQIFHPSSAASGLGK